MLGQQLADDFVAKTIDESMKKQDLTRWIVVLDDGTVVYQDDAGQGELRVGTNLSAWERLQNYCKNNNNYIVSMQLKFRSHIENMPSNAEGYFFRRSLLSGMGVMRTFRVIPDKHHYLVGILKDGKVNVQKWVTPELLLNTEEEDIRDPNSEDCIKSLIRKDDVTI